MHLILLVALLRARRQFVAPGDPATMLPLVQVGAAFALCLPLLTLYAYDNDAFSERIEEALLLLIGGARGPRALALAAADPGRGRPSVGDRDRAEALVQEHGHDSLAYFALRRDKSYFFSASGRSFLAYRVVGGTALVAGDPIGDRRRAPRADRGVPARRAREGLARRDRRRVERGARRLRRRSVSSRSTSATRRSSGPPTFSLEGRAIRKVRQSVSRLEKSGYEVRVLRPPVTPTSALRARAAGRLGGVAGQLARARLHDGDGRALRLPRHRARGGDRRPTARSAASCSSCPRPRATATRSRRCAGAATRRTA